MYQGSEAKRTKNPRQGAGCLALITHYFTCDIFKRSRRCQLEEKDIYEVLNNTKSSYLGDVIETEWAKERKKNHPSLSKTLFRVFGKEYIFYGVINFIFRTLLVVIKPAATGKLISYFTKDSELSRADAYYYAAVICTCITLMSVFSHFYYLTMCHLGLRLRAAMCALMYRKSLKLTSSSLAEVTNGKIVTMMTKDVQIFDMALIFAHDIWIGLSQMFVMGYIMYKEINISAVLGMALLFVLIPLQVWLGVKVKKMRLESAAKTDERLRRIQELLTSIKLIKLYAWQNFYMKITNKLRAKEVQKQRNVYYLNALIYILSNLSFRVSQYACILLYIYLDNRLTAEKLFIVITCYKAFQYVFTHAMPRSISLFADVKSAFKRIKHYLLIEEAASKTNTDISVKNPKVLCKNARVRLLEKILLKNIDVEVNRNSLVGITGAVGSGKTTFLKLVLQDVDLADGMVQVIGGVSYASQEPWLFPGTIRQNILFGQIFDNQRYQEVIKICALARDFEVFPDKDFTIVNDKGLNLSKGQQARINLARAIYKDCEIYLLDDVMAALDSKVSKYIFDECIKGFLKDKICFLVCHNKRCLKDTDNVLIFEDGTIKAVGTFEDLESAQINFGNTISVDNAIADKGEVGPVEGEGDNGNDDENAKLLPQTNQIKSQNLYGEHKEEGQVSFEIYKKLFNYAGGWKLMPSVLAICFLAQWAHTYFDLYVSKLLKAEQHLSEVALNYTLNYTDGGLLHEANDRREKALFNYTLVITFGAITLFMELFSFYGVATRAAKHFHCAVFEKIMGATMYFFDTHLSGNILNRFSKDIGICDDALPRMWFDCLRMPLLFVCIVAVIIKVNPIVIAPTAVLFGILAYARHLFLHTSRNLRRLDGMTRSPVIGFLNSTLEGLTTIRATGNQNILTSQFDGHQDVHSSASYMCLSINRAFGFWVNMVANVFITLIIFSFVVFSKGMENLAGDVGVAITQAFGLTGLIQWGVRQWAELENMMTSVERVSEYETLEQETLAGTKPENWPGKGLLEFKNVSLIYPNSDKVVLRDLNFTIRPREKIGIVGRTGAGKSSIISVLFRLYNIEGSVLIDNTDINDVTLDILRAKISIIPQDPVLFEGTVRSNLDPNGEHKDVDLWNALSEVELKNSIEKLPMGLDSVVHGGGSNWSIGQRQLLSLSRAILRNNKILVLDEATANIDPRTDALIQKTVRRVFKDCTILTIAHSLGTIIDSDKIMVIDFGSIIEFDSPDVLLSNEDGAFYSLVKRAAN